MEDVLPASILQAVLARTEALDCARAACVNRRWRFLASEDSIWSQHCWTRFGVSTPSDPSGNPCAGFKETYAIWNHEFDPYGGIVYRTKRCLDDLKSFLQSSYPGVADTLRRQAGESDIVTAEEKLGFLLPRDVRLIYRFCDGQEIPEGDDENRYQYLGLLGGYYFYNHFVNVQLLPLNQVVTYTQKLSSRFQKNSKRVIIAASCNLNKFFILDCDDGMIYVGTKNFLKMGEVMPCLPRPSSGNVADGMLQWLEEYKNGLLSGKYKVRNDEGIRSISLFPETTPLCTEAVTYGVQVRCSAVFVPELSTLTAGDREKYLFAYCVRMRFLPVPGLSFNQCQLSRRHWIISQDDVVVGEVRSEAVVGMFPLLKVGGDVFVYESCTGQNSGSGSMEGDFTFVPGSLRKQEGPDFLVRVAPFPLELPRYIF